MKTSRYFTPFEYYDGPDLVIQGTSMTPGFDPSILGKNCRVLSHTYNPDIATPLELVLGAGVGHIFIVERDEDFRRLPTAHACEDWLADRGDDPMAQNTLEYIAELRYMLTEALECIEEHRT